MALFCPNLYNVYYIMYFWTPHFAVVDNTVYRVDSIYPELSRLPSVGGRAFPVAPTLSVQSASTLLLRHPLYQSSEHV